MRRNLKKVLLVDDNTELLVVNRALLIDAGISEKNIIACTDFCEAMIRMKSSKFDLVIIDNNLSNNVMVDEGITLIEYMREETRNRSTPAYIITGDDKDPELIGRTRKAGVTLLQKGHFSLSQIIKETFDEVIWRPKISQADIVPLSEANGARGIDNIFTPKDHVEWASKTVLIVEDDSKMAEMAQQFLKILGFKIDNISIVVSAEDAKVLMKTGAEFDLGIIDKYCPKNKILPREKDPNRDIGLHFLRDHISGFRAAIMFCGSERDTIQAQVEALNAEFLYKPTRLALFEAAIESSFEKGKAEKQALPAFS